MKTKKPRATLIDEAKFPGYVTKCFLASGFDSEEAIASMDVTIDGPENSLKIMEVAFSS